MIAEVFFTLFGGFLTWVAVINWRHRKEEKISLLEVAILRTTGEEPLPLTKLDRWLRWFHIIMASILGPILLLVGLYGLLSELGAI